MTTTHSTTGKLGPTESRDDDTTSFPPATETEEPKNVPEGHRFTMTVIVTFVRPKTKLLDSTTEEESSSSAEDAL